MNWAAPLRRLLYNKGIDAFLDLGAKTPSRTLFYRIESPNLLNI
jgi:hypothetical protein